MNRLRWLILGCLIGSLTVLGCNDPAPATKATPAGAKVTPMDDDDHVHGTGPNGGVIFDLGKYHAEFTVNHDKKQCQVLVVADDEKTPLPVAATELSLTTLPTKTKDGEAVPALTITLKPVDAKDGKAATFVGTDPGLANVADFEGTVLGEIGGKPSQGEFKE